GGLVKGPDDALYGSTEQGGDLGFGTLFRYGSAFGDIMDLQFFNQVPVLTAIGQPGTNYVLERTLQLGPLASWSQVGSTNAPLTGGFSLADPGFAIGSAPQSFYRLRW
ncbi:MAG TPA: hypothetical protein VL793_14775, partial [Patescibacteria group bacterium]|nr:hypothetical protein [Patescibacteria group bacterium]